MKPKHYNKITIIITGSIAAKKAPQLIKLLSKDYQVNVILTQSASQFIQLNLITNLTNVTIYQNIKPTQQSLHIELAQATDLLIVYPASQNFVAKITHGFSDDLSSLIFASANCYKMVFPTMNSNMYLNPINLNNLNTLIKYGIEVLKPRTGKLACNTNGIGRAWEVEDVWSHVNTYFELKDKLKNQRVLLTFGKTRTYIDKIRYITNNSSGKMGLSLYQALTWAGAQVTNLVGDVNFELHIPHTKTLDNQTMLNLVHKLLPDHDILIANAALNDFKLDYILTHKINKTNTPNLKLNLVPNIDVLQSLNQTQRTNKIIIGFSAQDNNDTNQAKQKLNQKILDAIVLNHVNVMAQDQTQITWISHDNALTFQPMTKLSAAQVIINQLSHLVKTNKLT